MQNDRELHELAAQLCVDSIRASTEAGSGHPTSALSAAHLMAVLLSNHLRYDVDNPDNPANDRFVLSKGHATPLLYAALKALGAISDEQLLGYRKLGSHLEGHPVPVDGMPWVDVATGALGQGLSMGLGMALAMRFQQLPGRVWVLLGDSEIVEGSVWEAMANASHHGVANLIGILDMNRLGQRGPTMLQWDGDAYAARAEAFGWRAIQTDGHDPQAIDAAYRQAKDGQGPTLVVARTVKGWGVSLLADQEGWHGTALSTEQAQEAIEELGGRRSITITPPKPEPAEPVIGPAGRYQRPLFEEKVSTRKAFGQALAALAPAHPELVVLDGEVSNSTYTEIFQKAAPDRFLEMYIGEQNMIGAAVGLQALGQKVVAATFAAFMTRAYDFIRMAAVSRAHLGLSGSHAGVSIGQDGPSQMGLEDLAMMRAVHGSTVLYPCDGHSTVRLVEAMLDTAGISYLRTTREDTPPLYGPDEEFPVGGSKVLRQSGEDRATIVGAGVTVFEALQAADLLGDRHPVRVIDAYSVKPIDVSTLRRALEETGLMVVVEDHWREGGLASAVLEELAGDGAELPGRLVSLAVDRMPGSASPQEQREAAGISADKIAETLRRYLR
ncbi:MAG: transketolase [Acidimicrobiia bacterium]